MGRAEAAGRSNLILEICPKKQGSSGEALAAFHQQVRSHSLNLSPVRLARAAALAPGTLEGKIMNRNGRELKIERSPGESPFTALLRSKPKQDWHKLIANEGYLIPFILIEQRTMRLVKLIPTFDMFRQTEQWFNIRRQTDSPEQRRFGVWWELLFDVQRHQDDMDSIKLALAYIVQEQLKREYSKCRPVDPAYFNIFDDHALKIQIAVNSRIANLLPRQVAPGVDVDALLRIKHEQGD